MAKRRPRGFGPEARLRRKSEYARALEQGVSVRDAILKLVAARGAEGRTTRLGTAVSRRIGGAVERNRARRRIREAFRLARSELPEGLDLVVMPLAPSREPDFRALRASLVSLARKAAARLDAKERRSARPAPEGPAPGGTSEGKPEAPP